MILITDYYYLRSDSIAVQGNSQTVREFEKLGYKRAYGGHGSYRMTRPSETLLYFEDDEGVTRKECAREVIMNYYDISKLTEKKVMQFIEDVNIGLIDLKYTPEHGLYI